MNSFLAHQTPSFFSVPFWLHAKIAGRQRPARASFYQTRAEMNFTRNQINELKMPLGVTMECLSGRVWITIDGDPRDVVLDMGESFTVDRNRRTLIMALDEATLRCTDLA